MHTHTGELKVSRLFMPPITEHVVLRDNDVPNIADLDVYIKHEGYRPALPSQKRPPPTLLTLSKKPGCAAMMAQASRPA
jgi:hypothetical protein